MNVREAVFQVCDELGTRTSVEEIYRKAMLLCGYKMAKGTVQIYRCHYRKEKRIDTDCRTYRSQPRRNMLNDNLATLPQVKRIKHVLGLKRVFPESLLNLLGTGKDSFHSVEQLRNAVNDLIELRAAA